MSFRPAVLAAPAAFLLLLAGCEQLGIETPAQEMMRLEAEGKAIGSSCRQAGRALEDCYQINPKAPKAAIFTGWREMDAYMRENKIEEVKPAFPMAPPKAKRKPFEAAEEEAAPAKAEEKPADKAGEKPAEEKPKTEEKPTADEKPAAPLKKS